MQLNILSSLDRKEVVVQQYCQEKGWNQTLFESASFTTTITVVEPIIFREMLVLFNANQKNSDTICSERKL